MKTMNTLLLIALTALSFGAWANAQTARLQVIHNSPDPAAAAVDVYLNNAKLLDNFEFRKATPFIDAPAGVEFVVGIAPSTSSSVADVIAKFPFTLAANETYVVIASGVLNPAQFAANPDGKSTGFTLLVKAMAREAASSPTMVDFFALHGSTDAPTVDVLARNVATLVDNAAYGDMTGYLSVPPAKYVLDVTPGMDNGTVVASFEADLSGLAGGAATVFASGFLNPAANMNGAGFGLFAALPTGDVLALPVAVEEPNTARLQVIHNAADPAARSVDIYVNNELLIPHFRFRKATPFIDVPAGVALTVGVAPSGSKSAADIIATLPPLVLEKGKTYVAIANGVLNPSQFAPNPDGRSTAFGLFIQAMAKEGSSNISSTDVMVLHGVTDAPKVDVVERNLGKVVDDAGYGDMTGYLTLSSNNRYTIDVQLADNSATVTSHKMAFYRRSGLGAVIFASGFLAPAMNQNGEGFGLFVAYADGRVDELPMLTTARLQVIHNAADPAAALVDIYVNNALLIPNFAFRAATPFIDVPANVGLSVGVAPAGSKGPQDIIVTLPPVSLLGGRSYVAVAQGVVTDGFAANPNGLSTAFTLHVNPMAQERPKWSRFVELTVLHGATDAPAVDVYANGKLLLVDNLAYGSFTPYIRVSPASYELSITPAGMPKTVVATYVADLSGLRNTAMVVFASGFLTPSANNNGPAFGLFAALPNGAVVQLPTKASVGGPLAVESASSSATTPTAFELEQNYPNPFNPSTTIRFALPSADYVTLKVYDVKGREVASLIDGQMTSGNHEVLFNASNLSSGKYFYRLTAGAYSDVRQMVLIK